MPQGWGIVRSRFVDGKYQEYESLGPNVNFPHNDPHPNHSPTVDPDERFVIFVSRRPGGFGREDLYISYRQRDDTWGPAINLGPKINTIGNGSSWPQLSPDGKYLFFVGYIRPYNENDIKEKKYTYAELIEIQESIMNGWGHLLHGVSLPTRQAYPPPLLPLLEMGLYAYISFLPLSPLICRLHWQS